MMDYMVSIIIGLLLSLPAHTISELNEDFADEEFAHYFTSVYQTSIPQAKRNLDSFAKHLNLSNHQLESWQRFEITFLEQLEQRVERRDKLQQLKRKHQKLNSIDTLNLRKEHLQNRLQETYKMLSVMNNLYESLNDDQRVKFDRTMNHLWFKRAFETRHRN